MTSLLAEAGNTTRAFRIAADGAYETILRGESVLHAPLLNKSTAFPPEERAALGLVGLLPPSVTTLEEQVRRAYAQFSRYEKDLSKNIFLTALRDNNEVLFYRLLSEHLAEMLPIIYTPTVGTAIQRYSFEYRRPRGVFLSIDEPELIEESFRNAGVGTEDVDLIIATDGESLLGIGDWGTSGINICIGKLAVYTAAAGIHPARCLPVMLDVGTDREDLLAESLYLGNRHPRVRGERYDAFLDAYVTTAHHLFPNAILHWEDFAQRNAFRILRRYRDEVCTFNDDMQGSGGVVLAAMMSAARASGVPLRDQRVVIFGAGTSGIGNADQLRAAMIRDGLSPEEATRRFWCVDRAGLLVEGMGDALQDFQAPYARSRGEVRDWRCDLPAGGIDLAEVVRRVKPTALIGTSTAAGAFTAAVIREMAGHVERPIIFPLSNPSSLIEALPANLIAWTDGRGLIATGSPFPPITHRGTTYVFALANNALLFPGLAIGVIVSRARTITDGMFAAGARAIAEMVDARQPGASLLPHVEDLRSVSAAVASAVARAAADDGAARVALGDVDARVRDAMWEPRYVAVRPM